MCPLCCGEGKVYFGAETIEECPRCKLQTTRENLRSILSEFLSLEAWLHENGKDISYAAGLVLSEEINWIKNAIKKLV